MAKPVYHYGKWRVRPVDENGKRVSLTFDTFEDANFAAKKFDLETAEIQRGLRAPRLPEKSFEELCDYWLTHRAVHKRSIDDDRSIINCHLLPAFENRKLGEINVSDVDQYTASKQHLHKKTIYNHLTLLISLFNYAVDLGWLIRTPRIRKPKVRMFDQDFHYFRSEDEIKRFLNTVRENREDAFVLYATAIYTGMREGELAGLHWNDVDFDKRLITVQRSFDGPTKAGDVRYVPILAPLLPILRQWRLQCRTPLVFPNNVGTMHQPSARIFQEVFHKMLRLAGFEDVIKGRKKRPYLRFHDLRHTFASLWVKNGGEMYRLQKILGHKSMQMTNRYAHLAPDLYQEDFNRLGAADALNAAKVVDFQKPTSAISNIG